MFIQKKHIVESTSLLKSFIKRPFLKCIWISKHIVRLFNKGNVHTRIMEDCIFLNKAINIL